MNHVVPPNPWHTFRRRSNQAKRAQYAKAKIRQCLGENTAANLLAKLVARILKTEPYY